MLRVSQCVGDGVKSAGGKLEAWCVVVGRVRVWLGWVSVKAMGNERWGGGERVGSGW